MLTLRIHLDDVTQENGPLKVVVGSHKDAHDLADNARVAAGEIRDILVRRGDVLAMRPRLIHSSSGASPETHHHRRILHLEFAPREALPDGYQWADFWRAGDV